MELTMLSVGGLLLLGVFVGMVSGLLGIGGGVLVVPALVFLFGFRQQLANGTSLTMLFPPAAVPAILRYWREDNVHVWAAVLLAIGFVPGAWLGAKVATNIPEAHLRQVFAFFLLFIAGMMLFRGDARVRAVFATLLIVAGYAASYVALALLGRRWERATSSRRTAADIYREKVEEPFAPDYEI